MAEEMEEMEVGVMVIEVEERGMEAPESLVREVMVM